VGGPFGLGKNKNPPIGGTNTSLLNISNELPLVANLDFEKCVRMEK
jgi:hypothetical protein